MRGITKDFIRFEKRTLINKKTIRGCIIKKLFDEYLGDDSLMVDNFKYIFLGLDINSKFFNPRYKYHIIKYVCMDEDCEFYGKEMLRIMEIHYLIKIKTYKELYEIATKNIC